jgi:phage recombination protein Bet
MNQIEKSTFDVEKIKTYLKTMNLANNLSQQEVTQFIEIAQGFGLNPFKREIYASKYGNSFSVIVGYETYIKRAERSGLLSGWNVVTSGSMSENTLKATITIHRKDFTHPFIHEVEYSEYVQRTKEGRPTKFWSEKPLTMIKKVAMAQGFRLCFSDELGGMPYTAEELPEHHSNAIIPMQEDIEPLLLQIKEIKSVDDLAELWKFNGKYHSNQEFRKAVTDKKAELVNPDPKIEPGIPEAEIVEVIEQETVQVDANQIELFNQNQ